MREHPLPVLAARHAQAGFLDAELAHRHGLACQVQVHFVELQQLQGRHVALADLAVARRCGQGQVMQGQARGLQFDLTAVPASAQLAIEYAACAGHQVGGQVGRGHSQIHIRQLARDRAGLVCALALDGNAGRLARRATLGGTAARLAVLARLCQHTGRSFKAGGFGKWPVQLVQLQLGIDQAELRGGGYAGIVQAQLPILQSEARYVHLPGAGLGIRRCGRTCRICGSLGIFCCGRCPLGRHGARRARDIPAPVRIAPESQLGCIHRQCGQRQHLL